MEINSWIYFIGFEFFGLFFILIPFLLNIKNIKIKLLGNISLFISAIFLSLGLFEPILYFTNKISKTEFPKPPEILANHKSHSHNLIKNSILYILPPYFVPPYHGKFRTFGHSFTTNHLGFREKRFSHKKNKNSFRILIFGDSLTFGVGIDDDHRYSNVLEEMFHINYPQHNVEVLNFGMPGYSLDQEYELIKAILKLVECDLIVLGVFWNDFQMTTQKILTDYTRLKHGEPSQPFYQKINGKNVPIFESKTRNFNSIKDNSKKIPTLKKSWYKKTLSYRFLEKRTNINIDGRMPSPFIWDLTIKEFAGIKNLTNQYELPKPISVLLNIGNVNPNKNNFHNPKGDIAQTIRLYEFVGAKLKKEGFDVVETLPLFKKYSGMSMAVSEWEGHPNYLGHYIYAQSIYNFLTTKNLFKN
jgi:hypothetical protein